MKVGIIGLGFVGKAIYEDFKSKNIDVYGYDILKSPNTFEECLNTEILFIALPTKFDRQKNEYDKSIIETVCSDLKINKYSGIIINKSTVEPQTTKNLEMKFKELKFIHNPEFLTARTALEDFKNQKHIVLGKGGNCSNEDILKINNLYSKLYPNAKISNCESIESEAMKIFVNSFYAVKIQFFNELYLLCEKLGADYDTVKELMLENKWINPMHTNVPGPDGKLSYGGNCFPKDTSALLSFMKKINTPHKVLEYSIKERNEMRIDKENIL